MAKKNTESGGQAASQPATETAEPKKKRTRAKVPHLLEQITADGLAWSQVGTSEFEDTDGAVKHIEENNLVGDFRVVAVKRHLTATKVETVKVQAK